MSLKSELEGLIDSIATKFKSIYTIFTDTNDPTGFIDNDNIDVSYDATTRVITLTHSSGTLDYYWKGTKKSLVSPWVSTAHADDGVNKFLYSTDGINFIWSDIAWEFSAIQVAYASKNKLFGMREVHGIMQYQVHSWMHEVYGTIRDNGFGLVDGTFTLQPASPINTDNTPSFAAGVIKDEDIKTSLPLWSLGTYTTLYFTNTGDANFNTTSASLFRVTGSYPNINTFDGTLFTEIEATGKKYFNYYIIRMPVTSDTESQKYRAIVMQPQNVYSSSDAALAESYNTLNFGELVDIAPEFVIVERITMYSAANYSTLGKVRIHAHAILTGSRTSITAVSGATPTTAENVSFTPTVDTISSNVQDAIEEVQTEVTVNTAKTGITTQQAADIITNNSKVSYTDSIAVGLNTTHRGLTNNPHSVDKADVGLSNVPNIDLTGAVAINTDKISATGNELLPADIGVTVQAELGYTPVNKAGDTMTGALSIDSIAGPELLINSTYKSGLNQDVNGELLEFGTNYYQLGSGNYTPLHSGGMFRIDTRAGYEDEFFTVHHQDVPGTSTSVPMKLSSSGDLIVVGNILLGGTVDGIDIATDVAANTAKTTNATHTGDVTGSTTLTIASDVVDDTNLTTKFKGTSALTGTVVDWDLALTRTKTLTANITLTFSNLYEGVKFIKTTGDYSITFPSGFTYVGGERSATGTTWYQVICENASTPTGVYSLLKDES